MYMYIHVFAHVSSLSTCSSSSSPVSQGNGHERDFLGDDRVFILDMYNRWIYPGDQHAKQAIRRKVELDNHTNDHVYLEHIRR